MDHRLFSSRNHKLIKMLGWFFKPMIRTIFILDIKILEPLQEKPTLYVSNHNIGALIESHSILLLAEEFFREKHHIYGFTHPSIFRVPLLKNYFQWLGSVPATYDVAKNVFKAGHSLLIFPGGNKQALRSIWDYKKNSFREVHGWAKIAQDNQIDVVPITFRGSHFVNPVLFQSSILSKILILPWLLGLKWLSVSVAQILFSVLCLVVLLHFELTLYLSIPITIFVFCLTSLSLIYPAKISMTIHPRIKIENINQLELENKVAILMEQIYEN